MHLHIPIFPCHQQFLCISVCDSHYPSVAFYLQLVSLLRVFIKTIAPVLCLQSIPVIGYLTICYYKCNPFWPWTPMCHSWSRLWRNSDGSWTSRSCIWFCHITWSTWTLSRIFLMPRSSCPRKIWENCRIRFLKLQSWWQSSLQSCIKIMGLIYLLLKQSHWPNSTTELCNRTFSWCQTNPVFLWTEWSGCILKTCHGGICPLYCWRTDFFLSLHWRILINILELWAICLLVLH